jgi:hypothetical protein
MSRRKGEITGRTNERGNPHLVELLLPPDGFRSKSEDILQFHQARKIQIKHGRGRNEAGQFYVRYCFADAVVADAFRDRFGGERVDTLITRCPPSVK